MIEDLIKQEINAFIEQEIARIKSNEQIQKDPELVKAGITRDYLNEVENLLSVKNIDKAKQILNELDEKIKKISDEVTKNKAYNIRLEVSNAIELSEKIESNKKDLELKLKTIKQNKGKSFFDQESQAESDVLKKMNKGINSSAPENSAFFTSAPTKLTVVQHIMTPDQPMPSINQNNSQSAPTEQTIHQMIMPTPVAMPMQSASPVKNFDEEFSKVNFVISELHTLLQENDLLEAKNEYGRARNLLEGLPESEMKHKLSNELFKAYHEIKNLERKEEEKRYAKKQDEKKILRDEEFQRLQNLEKQNRDHEQRLFDQLKNTQQKIVMPDTLNINAATFQQKILEEKHKSIKEGKIPEELHTAQEKLNTIQSLKPGIKSQIQENKNIKPLQNIPPKKIEIKPVHSLIMDNPHDEDLERKERKLLNDISEEHHVKENIVMNKPVELPIMQSFDNNDIELMYDKGVGLLYNGNIGEAKQIFERIIRQKPYYMAARIRLKECNNAN